MFLVAMGIMLVGFVLILLGSTATGSSGGCFFWPLPLVLICGLATGTDLYVALGLFSILLVVLFLLFFWWGKWKMAH